MEFFDTNHNNIIIFNNLLSYNKISILDKKSKIFLNEIFEEIVKEKKSKKKINVFLKYFL